MEEEEAMDTVALSGTAVPAAAEAARGTMPAAKENGAAAPDAAAGAVATAVAAEAGPGAWRPADVDEAWWWWWWWWCECGVDVAEPSGRRLSCRERFDRREAVL